VALGVHHFPKHGFPVVTHQGENCLTEGGRCIPSTVTDRTRLELIAHVAIRPTPALTLLAPDFQNQILKIHVSVGHCYFAPIAWAACANSRASPAAFVTFPLGSQ
jgi:hypothetical protein